jgi:hypothetical protein
MPATTPAKDRVEGDRAAWLNRVADAFLTTSQLPNSWDYENVKSISVERKDGQLFFAAGFSGGYVAVCSRPVP